MPTSGVVALGEAGLSFLAAPCGGGGGVVTAEGNR